MTLELTVCADRMKCIPSQWERECVCCDDCGSEEAFGRGAGPLGEPESAARSAVRSKHQAPAFSSEVGCFL